MSPAITTSPGGRLAPARGDLSPGPRRRGQRPSTSAPGDGLWRGTASSSDGQLFLTAGRGEAAGNVNARAGRDPAVSIYTPLSHRYVPFYTRLTASHGEAAHVIDGLLYHEADLTTSVHHTDGGGVSDHVFGLAHLLGFRFAPRIPNLAERRLYTFGLADNWPA